MFLLYDLFLLVVSVVALPFWLRRKHLGSLRERLGRYDTVPAAHDVWLHAVSVGEVNVARLIAESLEELRPELRLVVTTTTATGQRTAERLFHEATVTYFPFDFTVSVERFLRHHRPRVFASIETEIWPNVVRLTNRRGTRLVLSNARLSDESYPRYRRLRFLLRPLLVRYSAILARDENDRRRFVAIGAREEIVSLGGNVKFDYTPDSRRLEIEPQLRSWIGARQLFVAGSTMAGEDEMLIGVMKRILDLNSVVAIAPRKPERFDEVAELLRDAGFSFTRRSQMDSKGLNSQILLLDSFGELARVYRLATAAFIGGSLVPAGGHNPIESAAVGTPTAFGPHMSNFRDVATTFLAANAARQVNDVGELVSFVEEMIQRPERRAELSRSGRETVERNRGAARRNAEKIAELLA